MAGLPYSGLEAGSPGEAGNVVSHSAAAQHHDEEAGGEFARLRKAVLQHVDPMQHSRHAVYTTAKVRFRRLSRCRACQKLATICMTPPAADLRGRYHRSTVLRELTGRFCSASKHERGQPAFLGRYTGRDCGF